MTLHDTGNDAATIATAAERIRRLADAFGDSYTASDVGKAMTCGEADALADVIRLVDPDAAARLLRGHAEQDDEGDSHHHLRVDHGDCCDGDALSATREGEGWIVVRPSSDDTVAGPFATLRDAEAWIERH